MARTHFALPLALALAAVTAPAAHADSIAYVKAGNVFLTTPDGTTTQQLTTSGGYASVSQSDAGTLVALKGTRLHVMNRYGDVLQDFTPVGSGTAGSIKLTGPFDPAISPDGTKIAYGFFVQYTTGDPNCGKPGGCMQGQLYTGVGYTRVSGATEWNEPGFRPQYSWTDPSWIDDREVLMASPTSAFVKQTAVDTAGDGADAAPWFSDGGVRNLYDGELNRQRTAAAFVGNTEADHLVVYRTPAGTTADPVGCLDAPVQGGRWSSPSWSPSGDRLAWAGPRGLYVAELPGIGAACPTGPAVKVSVIAEGATSPDWGPADLPAPRATAPAAGGSGSGGGATPGAGGGSAAPGGGPVTGERPAAPVITARRVSRATLLRSGRLSVTVRCASGTLAVTAKVGATVIASGRTACTGAPREVRLRLSRTGRERLRTLRRGTITVSAPAASPVRIALR